MPTTKMTQLKMSKIQPKVWKERLIIAMEKNLGIVTAACKEVGVSRDRFYTYYKEDPAFKAAIDEIDDYTTDYVESQLFKKIKQGDRASILFYMKHKGRKRGYTESITMDTNVKIEQPLLTPLENKEIDK
jgi:hypothetical protein